MLSAGYRAITITKNHKRLTKIARYRTITIGRYHEELTKIGKKQGYLPKKALILADTVSTNKEFLKLRGRYSICQ